MRWGLVRVVYRRELRDVLRDRRTLFTMIGLPVILYPLLMLGITRLTVSRTQELLRQAFPVVVRVGDRPLLRGRPGPEPGSLEAAVAAVEQFSFREASDPEAMVRTGEIKLFVRIPEGAAPAVEGAAPVVIVPQYRSSDEESAAALRLFREAFDSWRDRTWPVSLSLEGGDRSTEGERGGRLWGGLLAMMVVMMAMTGAFYPALDIAAGEKERGTLETLLLSPASRRELVAGKYLTVLSVALVAALANLGSLTFTVSGFSSMIGAARGEAASVSLPPQSLAVILLGLAITAGLFSALCLALSTFARTYKEGQAYLTPALILVMPLSMAALLPNLRLDLGMALVPVANLSLLMKDLLMGILRPAEAAVTMATLALLAAAALHWTASLFEREEVLFREGRQIFGLRPPPGVRRPERPGAGVAVLGFLLGLAFLYHASLRLQGAGVVTSHLVVMGGLAAIGLGLPRLALVRLRSGLALGLPPASGLAAGVLVGAAGVAVSLGVGGLQERVLGAPEEVAEQLRSQLAGILGLHPVLAILLLGVVPALAEELLFRGLILQGLRGALRDGGALLASAAGFGAFHLSVHRFFPQMILGLLLGGLVLRSRSIIPAMIAHAVHNGILVSAARAMGPDGGEPTIPTWLGPVALVVAAGALRWAGPRAAGDQPPP